MPREQITHNRIIESRTPASEDGIPSATINVEEQRRNLHIAWHPRDNGWVQVGIDLTVAELRSMLAHAEEQAQSEARRLADMGEYAVDAHQYRVMSDVFDRAEVNQAIHVLRRARDSAYGKDA